MNARKEAERFLDQLRKQTHATLGTIPYRPDPAIVKDTIDRFLRESLIAEESQDPHVRALYERGMPRLTEDFHGVASEFLARRQSKIEKFLAGRGVELGSRRPLVGFLQTGQVNAVSMRVPGRAGAYLVLFEDQMLLFALHFSNALVWAFPTGPEDTADEFQFEISKRSISDRIESVPEIADRFADIVVAYAVTGRLGHDKLFHLLPPGYNNVATQLCNALEDFVLAHEYGHILDGHLDTTPGRKGVLPVAEAEVLAYSWIQEYVADLRGMAWSINTGIEHHNAEVFVTFMAISLFFDASDVMDRAVALLQTGDENACQLGSHPPSRLRKENLRNYLPKMAAGNARLAEKVRTALELTEIQEEVIRLLWERTRPILLDLHQRGVPAAPTWRTIPRETHDQNLAPK